MKIGFIGCGNMGSAMIGGILKNGVFEKNEIIVSNLTEEGSRRSQEKLGVVTTLDNCEVVKNANIVILAVKPQFYEEVIGEIKSFLTPQHMIVGIAPGKTLAWLEEKCEQPLKVVRLMPNTPAQVGAGMTGACVNDRVTEEDLDQILAITNSFGRTEVVPERLLAQSVGALRLMYLCLLKQWQMPLWHRECQENRPISLLPRLYLEVRSCFWRQVCIREN